MRRNYLIAIFLVFALGGYAAYRVGIPLTPENALKIALLELGNAEQVSGMASVALSLSGEVAEPIALRGAFGLSFPKTGAPSAVATFASVEQDGRVGIQGIIQTYPAETYFKLNNVPEIEVGGLSITELAGTWWKITPAGSNDASADAIYAAEAWRRLRKLVVEGTMFAMDSDVAREAIAGRPAYRYTIALSKSGLEEFVRIYREVAYARAVSAAEVATLDKFADAFAAEITVWVDVKTGSFAEILVSLQSNGDSGPAQSVLVEAIDYKTPLEAMVAPTDFKEFVRTAKVKTP